MAQKTAGRRSCAHESRPDARRRSVPTAAHPAAISAVAAIVLAAVAAVGGGSKQQAQVNAARNVDPPRSLADYADGRPIILELVKRTRIPPNHFDYSATSAPTSTLSWGGLTTRAAEGH